MSNFYGTGEYQYKLVDGWAKLPEKWSFFDVCGLASDANDHIYILNRSEHPVMVFDREGNLLESWGQEFFNRAHGSYISSDGFIYCTDYGNHTVSKFTLDGGLIFTLGGRDEPSDTGFVHTPGMTLTACLPTIKRGGPPFNRPTGVAVASSGDIFVSDGYGNARVHRFSADGQLLLSWGEPGDAPGQFMLPHSIWVDMQDNVWVVDRENGRIQIFDIEGRFIDQWKELSRPTDLIMDDEGTVYVSELNQRLSIFQKDGKLLTQWGSQGENPDTALFLAPHAVTVDSQGALYIGEVSGTFAKVDRGARAVQKFTRIR
jgi:DNA-binding beta-propeller fold protein YncE